MATANKSPAWSTGPPSVSSKSRKPMAKSMMLSPVIRSAKAQGRKSRCNGQRVRSRPASRQKPTARPSGPNVATNQPTNPSTCFAAGTGRYMRYISAASNAGRRHSQVVTTAAAIATTSSRFSFSLRAMAKHRLPTGDGRQAGLGAGVAVAAQAAIGLGYGFVFLRQVQARAYRRRVAGRVGADSFLLRAVHEPPELFLAHHSSPNSRVAGGI